MLASRGGPENLVSATAWVGVDRKDARQPTILVVEDEESISNILVALLEYEGYRVIGATRGEEAISLAREIRPDLITLDLALPDMSGEEVVRHLDSEEESCQIPIVVISAYTSFTNNLDSRRQIRGIISKPFDVDHLLRVVRDALDG